MNNRRGFTLIELLVALSCTVLLVGVFVSFTMRLYDTWYTTAQKTQSVLAMHAAIDVVRADLQRAPRASSAWIKSGPHELLWRTSGQQALRIMLVNDRLERSEGSFNERTQTWHGQATSVLAQGVAQIRCGMHNRTAITCDACTLTLVMRDGKEGIWLLAIG